MKLTLAFLFVALDLFAAQSLLILTEPTARGITGPIFDRWIAQIRQEGWSVSVREAPRRWGGSYWTNDWGLINWMSNEIARANPDAVQLYGCMARMKTGKHQADGHEDRCITTINNLACSNLVYTDTENFSNMVSWPIEPAIPNSIGTNVPGDGVPDQVYGTFARPVSSIDASGLTYTAGNFASGYYAGQSMQPAIDEGYWLRCFLTNNIEYRRAFWSVASTGHISGGWLNSSTITATNNSVSWSVDSSSIAGNSYVWVYDNKELNIWSPHFVSDAGQQTSALVFNQYKSYGMEDANGVGTYRRILFPGFAPKPFSVGGSGWSQGANGAQFFWMSKASDLTLADGIRSSVVRFGGVIPFEMPIAGDLTLPIRSEARVVGAHAYVGTLTIQ